MGLDPSAVWDFAREVVGAVRPDRGRTLATVTRIDADGTTWVTTGDGGEAPASSVAAGVSVGDTVALEWDGASMGIRSNVTNPSPAGSVIRRAVERTRSMADAAQRVADAVNQHFFADTSGIHVTEATQEEWDASHAGANVLINSVGQLFRDGLNNLLTLTTEGNARALTIWDGLGNAAANVRAIIGEVITLGPVGSVRMILSSDGMEIDNEVGTTIFAVESNSTGTTTATALAVAATWVAEADVIATTYPVSDASAASGDATVTATIADTDYTLDSTYATATVTTGTGVSVALTSDGVDYVRELMSDAEVTTGTLSVEYQRTVADSASLTFDGSQLVNGSGRAIALLNGVSGTETFFDAHNTVTDARVLFGVGTGGWNRGLWDELEKSWIVYRNSQGRTVIGGPNFSVDANGLVKTGRKVVAAGNKMVALAASAASGSTNRGLWDETGGAWIIYRSTGGSIVLGDSVSDVLYHRESTCSAKTANATFYNNYNFCWNNGACCTVQLCVNLKSSLANADMVDVAEAPSGYRPPHVVFGSVRVTGQNINLQAVILGDGTIRINNSSGTTVTSSANIYMSFTFAP